MKTARKKPDVSGKTRPRTILLAVSGMSPAILTETIWALAKEKPSVVPDEVIVLTTVRGSQDIEAQLLTPRKDWGGVSPWEALRKAILGGKADKDLRLQFVSPRVIELPDPRRGVKRPAEDLRSPDDNAAAADFILEEVRRLTENPDTRVIASLAGGRKTMGALLYASVSLLGRDNDRITHVLVNDPYDQCRDFFYPTQPLKRVTVGQEKCSIPAAKAEITLADIPFVPLRNLFEKEFRRLPGDFLGLVAGCRKELALLSQKELRVRIHRSRRLVEINGSELQTSTREHILLLLLAEKFSDSNWVKFSSLEEDLGTLSKILLTETPKNDFSDWRHQEGGVTSFDEAGDGAIRKALSSLRKKLKALGPEGAAFAAALPEGRRVSLHLPRENVKIVS